METKFNSQICTSREQSERLLKLGLKKETADVTIHHEYGITTIFGIDYSKYVDLHKEQGYTEDFFKNVFPAWSMHRLMSLMPRTVEVDGRTYGCMMELGSCVQYINLLVDKIIWAAHYSVSNSFDGLIDCIEWLINEGYFNKEYLV